MFIGFRDIRFARGRFALICAVITMMTLMVVALSALTSGLQGQSISAIMRLPGESLVLASPGAGQEPSLSQSDLPQPTVRQIVDESKGDAAELGVAATRLSHDGVAVGISVFGADARLMPAADAGVLPGPGEVMLAPKQAAELGVAIGDRIMVGTTALRVAGFATTGHYAHTPVAYTTIGTWRELTDGRYASAVVLWRGPASVAGTAALPMSSAADAVPGYGSERGSLVAMQLMLLIISALVVGAFFAVWTIQRLRDLAIIRAMGASRAYLLRDGLGQAVLVLVAGETLGTLLGLALVAAVSGSVPVSVSAAVVAMPVGALAVLGTLGALLAVRRVTAVDPLVALAR